MSKSVGNVILAKHFYQKYGANVLRYIFLNTHYNQVINFNETIIQQASDYTQKIKYLLKRLKLYFYWQKENIEPQKISQNSPFYPTTLQPLSDNLNTVKVFYYLDEIIYRLNKQLDEKEKYHQSQGENLISQLASILYAVLVILGFKFELVNYDPPIYYLLDKWQRLRQSKQFTEADQIRKQLQEKDVI